MSNGQVPPNGAAAPILELDPNAVEFVNGLIGLANAIAQGAPLGGVLLFFDHTNGGVSMKSYNVGDPHRCLGFLHDTANTILTAAKRAQQGKPNILIAR